MQAIEHVTCIPLWDCLLVPLHGDIPDTQADAVVNEVLEQIQQRGYFGVLVELSGVAVLDSHLCSVLAKLALAARLMGAQTVIAGMRPEIAMTLETMGIELRGIRTEATLEDALESMGITRIRRPQEEADDLLVRSLLGDEQSHDPQGDKQ
jgi:rsbT antagonist protein RsbS